MNFCKESNEQVGDLFWRQLSQWDFSDKEHIDVFSHDGFHFELMVITKIISDVHKKIRNVKVDELTTAEVDRLKPEKGCNWNRSMGNISEK